MLEYLAKLWKVSAPEAEDVLRHDEARARATVQRRQFLSAAAALATAPFLPKTFVQLPGLSVLDAQVLLDWTEVFAAVERDGWWSAGKLRARGKLICRRRAGFPV